MDLPLERITKDISLWDIYGSVMARNWHDHLEKIIKTDESLLILDRNLEEHLATCQCTVDAS